MHVEGTNKHSEIHLHSIRHCKRFGRREDVDTKKCAGHIRWPLARSIDLFGHEASSNTRKYLILIKSFVSVRSCPLETVASYKSTL